MRFASLLCLLLTTVVVPSEAMAAVAPSDPGDLTQTYDFDELQVSCGYFGTTSGYADLVFSTPAYLSRCNTPNGTVGLVPSQLGVGPSEVKVRLPAGASVVSIESYLFGAGGNATLIGYDSDGVEVARASSGTLGSWTSLEVRGDGATIVEVGLLMPQLTVYLDNLTATYGEVVEELPSEGPGPASDPVTRADCTNGSWADYGFRNQGQCVRFVMTGKESR